jgi:hypothetical protein
MFPEWGRTNSHKELKERKESRIVLANQLLFKKAVRLLFFAIFRFWNQRDSSHATSRTSASLNIHWERIDERGLYTECAPLGCASDRYHCRRSQLRVILTSSRIS